MKIYDISQEVFGCKVFPSDPVPNKETVMDMKAGALYNLTAFSMCAHNGTHLDAPKHFYADGKSVDEIDLGKIAGLCYVFAFDGILSGDDAKKAVKKAKEADSECWRRLLFKGNTVVSEEAAHVFADEKIYLVGNESQTVGPENAPMAVHLILLKEEIVLLEGIRLSGVPEGKYFLCAAPLNLGGADGSPCRAILMSEMR